MDSYVIYTDSTCDITPELTEEWGVMCVSMFVSFDNEEIEYKRDSKVKDLLERIWIFTVYQRAL